MLGFNTCIRKNMSKLYKNYVLLKINKPEKIYLFKSGIFYIFIDEDAKLMSEILKLKLSNLNHNIVKCGFPSNSLDKYMTILKNLNYDVEIFDSQTNSIFNYDNYLSNEKIKQLLNDINNIEIDKLSISQTYEILNQFKKDVNDILNFYSNIN